MLASIIWVALYGMFKQFGDIWSLAKVSVWDMVRLASGISNYSHLLVLLEWLYTYKAIYIRIVCDGVCVCVMCADCLGGGVYSDSVVGC